MITGRRAEQFHELVEGRPAAGGARTPAYADLLDLVGALRETPPPVADPAFVASLRDRLLAEADTVLVAAAAEREATDARLRLHTSSPRTRRRRRRLAAAVSGVVLAGTATGMAVAAQSALPGDALYPLKRGLENAHAELTFDRAARGRVLLASAATRLDEVQALTREGASSNQVAATLDAFTQETIDGADLLVADYQATGDRSSMTTLRTFTATSMSRLSDLQGSVPQGARGELLQAAQALDQVQQVSLHACPSCTGPLATSVPPVLAAAAQAANDTWQVAATDPHHARQPGTGPFGTPQLPDVSGDLPPASVTDLGQTGTDPLAPTAHDVQHTLHHLTQGLTDPQQSDLGTTVTDTANNLLDAVGAAGDQVTGTLGNTVDGVTSLLPSDQPSLP